MVHSNTNQYTISSSTHSQWEFLGNMWFFGVPDPRKNQTILREFFPGSRLIWRKILLGLVSTNHIVNNAILLRQAQLCLIRGVAWGFWRISQADFKRFLTNWDILSLFLNLSSLLFLSIGLCFSFYISIYFSLSRLITHLGFNSIDTRNTERWVGNPKHK